MRGARTPSVWIPSVLTLILSGISAQESRSAAAITARGRSLAQALDTVLGGGGRGAPEQRTLLLLIDPSPGLKQAGFAQAFAQGLRRNAARLAKTKIAITTVPIGAAQRLEWQPASNADALVAAVTATLAAPKDQIRNVYKSIRTGAAAFPPDCGRAELTLVSLTNGDAEDDLEGTVSALKRNDVVFRCIASESYLCDSYWAARPSYKAPRKCKLTGGDGAFVALPWGWLMQSTITNEVSPAAVPIYGLSRLCATSKGSAHLYSKPSPHRCAVYGGCLFCDNDHSGSGETYWAARLSRYSASTNKRTEVFAAAAADPAFRAMLEAWQKASRAGLVRGTPSVRITGNGLAPQRARVGRLASVFISTGFARNASKAIKLTRECDKIRNVLRKRLAASKQSKSIPRYRAMAEFTAVMLQLTKVNLLTYAGWCRDIAPGLSAKKPEPLPPPEADPVPRPRRAAGIGFSNYTLCHGVRPFFGVELPGGKPFRDALAELDRMVTNFENLYGHTPIASGLRRSGIAHFRLTFPGLAKGPVRRRPRSSNDRPPVTERGRPARPGRSSGGSAGPTTGRRP